MFQVFIGFIPWIIYWSFSGPGLWTIAILGGLVAPSGRCVSWRWRKRRDVKTMEVVTLGYFAVHAIITLVIGSSFLKTYGPIVNSLVLAGMAFGTLAMKNPFTYQYAKEDWDKSYWTDPAFIRINEIITGVWGGIFLFNTLLGALAVFVFPEQEIVTSQSFCQMSAWWRGLSSRRASQIMPHEKAFRNELTHGIRTNGLRQNSTGDPPVKLNMMSS